MGRRPRAARHKSPVPLPAPEPEGHDGRLLGPPERAVLDMRDGPLHILL